MSELSRQIENRSIMLTEQAVNRMYADPFWGERFGEPGRFYVERDTRRTLAHLTQSLRFGSAEVFVNYTRWLQTVLTTRGMCTKHIADHFDRLIDAIMDSDIPDPDEVIEIIHEGLEALVYAEDPARDLQLETDNIVERAFAVARNRDRGSGDPVRFQEDLRLHLSYLADSLHLDRPDVYVDYVGWIGPYYARRRRAAGYAETLIAVLIDAVGDLPAASRDLSRAYLRAARSSLSRPVAG